MIKGKRDIVYIIYIYCYLSAQHICTVLARGSGWSGVFSGPGPTVPEPPRDLARTVIYYILYIYRHRTPGWGSGGLGRRVRDRKNPQPPRSSRHHVIDIVDEKRYIQISIIVNMSVNSNFNLSSSVNVSRRGDRGNLGFFRFLTRQPSPATDFRASPGVTPPLPPIKTL